MKIPKLSANDPEFQKRFSAVLADGIKQAAPSTCGWVIDVRHNHGGDMWPMTAGVAALLPDGKTLSFVSRTAITDVTVKGGEVASGGQAVFSAEVGPKINQPIAVLHDEETGSSGEAVVVAFRGLPNARSFGTPTAGYSSANQTVPLYDGASMLLTTAVFADRNGQQYGAEINPDQPAPAAATEQSANQWLQTQCR